MITVKCVSIQNTRSSTSLDEGTSLNRSLDLDTLASSRDESKTISCVAASLYSA